MTRLESEPLTTTTRTSVLNISIDKDSDGKDVRVAHVNLPFGVGAGIIALGKNHDIQPGQGVNVIQKVYEVRGRNVTSSSIEVAPPPTP